MVPVRRRCEGQRVHHAGCALRAPIAGIGAGAGKGHGVQRLQFVSGLGNEQSHFPMTGVKAESDRLAVLSAQTTMRAKDKELRAEQAIRIQPMPAFWLKPKRFPEG